MDDEIHLVDNVDYRDLFSRSLTLVGKGASIRNSLESCARERYPLAYRDVLDEAQCILERLKEERGWGTLRALRELAEDGELVEALRARRVTPSGPNRGGTGRSEVIANFPRVFSLAQRKRQAGFSLEDAIDMAVRELYPQTHRKVREAALAHVRQAARRLRVHELRALRELAEDPELFRELCEGGWE
ncbi:MAG: hypothetical protein H5T73_08685 [Actinobacteria bacterium]|nr:hypothetical protein [Actinomycetota bacterium]